MVLDCFAGDERIWREIQKRTGRKIYHLPIDVLDYGKFHLPGNNLKYLKTMDISKFNVIDLDCYGVPYKQLEVLFNRGYKGIIFVTFIQSLFGNLPHGLLQDIGFTKAMIDACPTLCCRNGFDHLKEYLSLREIKIIWHISPTDQKHYLCLQI